MDCVLLKFVKAISKTRVHLNRYGILRSQCQPFTPHPHLYSPCFLVVLICSSKIIQPSHHAWLTQNWFQKYSTEITLNIYLCWNVLQYSYNDFFEILYHMTKWKDELHVNNYLLLIFGHLTASLIVAAIKPKTKIFYRDTRINHKEKGFRTISREL